VARQKRLHTVCRRGHRRDVGYVDNPLYLSICGLGVDLLVGILVDLAVPVIDLSQDLCLRLHHLRQSAIGRDPVPQVRDPQSVRGMHLPRSRRPNRFFS